MLFSGNAIIVTSTVACVIGLTWGGIRFPWISMQVLIPLVLGLIGLLAFVVFEYNVPREPLVGLVAYFTIYSLRWVHRFRT